MHCSLHRFSKPHRLLVAVLGTWTLVIAGLGGGHVIYHQELVCEAAGLRTLVRLEGNASDGRWRKTSEGTTSDAIAKDPSCPGREAVQAEFARVQAKHARDILIGLGLFWALGAAVIVAGGATLARQAAEREQVQNELRAAKENAEIANRAKSEFLANMSHEIRSPMTAILGYADALSDRVQEPELREAVQVIKRNGCHLLEVVNDILDLSKIEMGEQRLERTACSPRRLAEDVLSMMRLRADGKGLYLDLECPGDIPETIYTDPLRLRQILSNLVGNAIKFTLIGGVRVVMRMDTTFAGDAKLRFDVIDTGIGMSEPQIAMLFRPFPQVGASTRRRFGGIGLGLAISEQLARMLGGDIAVSSRLGKGSTFSATIAIAAMDDAPATEGSAELEPLQATGERRQLKGRVLLAEDALDSQRLVQLVLRNAGAEVVVANHGKQALELAMQESQTANPFDLILMDMQMPVMDGYQATRKLRSAGFLGPIIALTAHAMKDDRRKCLDAGCDDYLSKPLDRNLLVETVAKHLGSGLAAMAGRPELDAVPLAETAEGMAAVSSYASLAPATADAP